MAVPENSLSYTGRDVVDIRQTLVDLIPKITDKWKDYSESDLGMIILELIAAAQDMQNFYFDTQAFETYLDTAQQEKNIRSILRAMNYRIPLWGSAKGEVTVTFRDELEYQFKIPKYTQFRTSYDDGNLGYVAIDTFVAYPEDTELKVSVIEGEYQYLNITKGELKKNTTVSGNISRRIYLEETNIAEHSVEIDQENEIWEECDDALLKYNGGRYFSVHKDSADKVYLLMSVNFMDLLPDNDDEIVTIKYVLSSGRSGMVKAGAVNRVDAGNIDQTKILSVTNELDTYGAYDEPTALSLKLTARRAAQNMDRYITLPDYQNGVEQEPYIMRYVVRDWKTPKYVDVPYEVHIWAVDWSGKNLGEQDIATLKNKFYDKGQVDTKIIYNQTEYYEFELNVKLHLKATTEEERQKIKEMVYEALSLAYDMDVLVYGFKLSLALLESKILQMSNYIRSVEIQSPESDIVLDEIVFPKITAINVTAAVE